MKIKLQETYEINNLIVQSGEFTSDDFQKAVQNILNVYKDIAIQNGEYIITTTKSVNTEKQIIDAEILLPVSYRVPVEVPYEFKQSIKINNALYTKVEDISKLQIELNEVNNYIIENKLQPITSAYLVQSKQNDKLCIEIYIGLNPNIL